MNQVVANAQPVFETRAGFQVNVNDFMKQKVNFVPMETVYGVEGLANARVTIEANGEVRIDGGDGMLFLNFGSSIRAQEFFARRLQAVKTDKGKGGPMFAVTTKSFEVPRWFLEQLRAEAKAEALSSEFPGAPLKVDQSKAPNQFGLRPAQVEKLRDVIVPGSGREQ